MNLERLRDRARDPAPRSLVSGRTVLAARFTSSGACPIANERPATANIDTSFSQSPTQTISSGEQPWCAATNASGGPFGPAGTRAR